MTCVSAADENQAADIVTQDSEIIANESIANYEYDEGNDVLSDMDSTHFTQLADEINDAWSSGYYELNRDFEFDADRDSRFVNGIDINIDNLIIDGKGHTIDADCKAKIFNFKCDNVTLKNINFVNGNSTDGGALINFKDGTIVNCTFTNCYFNGEGSMISFNEQVTVKSSNFTHNNVNGSGIISSAMYETITVENCLFEDNVGRAVYAQGPLTVIDSTFNRNNENDGGALYLGYTGTIKGSVFNGNSAENGGAICLDYGLVEIDDCVFNGNTADKGGAIFIQSVYVTLNVNNTIFSDNEARDGTNNIASGRGKVNLNNVTPEDLSPFAGVDFKYLEYNQNLIYGEDLIIEFIISCTGQDISVLGGNLSIAINGKNYNTTVTSSDVKFNISDDFPVGDYSANLTYFHKEHQLKKVQLITFHVSTGDDDPNLDIIIDNVGQDKPATVQITTNQTFSGNVEVIIDNGASYTVAVTNGGGSIEISGLSRGDHTAKAIFPAWNSFRYSEKTVSFRILKNDPGLRFYFDNWIHSGETSHLEIYMNDAIYDGTVYVYFNGTLNGTFTNIYEGRVLENPTIFTDGFPVGEYPIRVVFSGNDNFESSEKTDTLRIVRIENRFSDLNEILKNSEQKVTLDLDYIFDPEFDSELTDGIDMIYHYLEIDGQGHTIDAKGLARFFTFHDHIVLKNIVFANGIGTGSVDSVIHSENDATLENCTFINNSGNQGVVYFMKGATVKDSSFTDGYATFSGGALYFEQGGLVENCSFTNNSAFNYIMYNGRGGAIYSNSGILTVTGSRFTNNHAGMGGAIFTKGDIIVNSTIFADNVATDLADNIALYNDATISVSDVDPEDLGVLKDVKIALAEDVQNITAGEVLNITVSVKNWGTPLNVGSAYITINGKKFSAEVTNGIATIRIANLRSGNYSGNVSYELENVNKSIQTINVKFTVSGNSTEPVDPKLNITVGNVYEGVDPVATITADADFSGSVTVEINSTGAAYLVMVQNGNGTVKITGLSPGIHAATVTFGGDSIYGAGSATTTFEVMPLENSTVSINDIVFDYGKTGSTEFSLTGATAVNASVVNHTEAVITVEGNVIKVSNLNAGNYTLNVTTIPAEGYRAVTETVSITVNKVDANFSLSNVTVIYGNHVVVAGVFGDGVTGFNTNYYRLVCDGEELQEVGVGVNGNYITLYIGDAELLVPGNYTFTIGCTVDGNHNAVTATSHIVVKEKVQPVVTVTDVVYTYGGVGTSTVTFVGATEITAVIVGHSEANVTYANGVITISGLDAGNYTLNVTTVKSSDYDSVSATANVTVNKAGSDVNIVGDIVFDWGTEFNITADLTNATWGINVRIVGNDNAARDESNTIFISNLKAGTHTLIVETVTDVNHNSVSKNYTVTVNKVKSEVKLDNFEFEYGNEDLHALEIIGGSRESLWIVGHEGEDVFRIDGNIIHVYGLDAGNYTLKVITTPDENHTAVEKLVNVTVNKINSTLVMPAIVTAKYGEVANIDFTVEGATVDLANITIYGPTGVYVLANVELNGTRIIISNFEMRYFNVTVVTTPDKNHLSVNGSTRLIVDPAHSEVNVTDVVYTYGGVGTSTVTLVGATNVTAVIVGHSEAIVTYADGMISISGLDAGNYTLNVTTKPDYNHDAVSTTANVTVNKAGSDVNIVGDIVFDWGTEFNITADLTNATQGINVRIVGNDNAARDEDNIIFISNLKAGTHTLIVETVTDVNHISVSKNYTVTVNKVKSEVKLDNFEFEYGNEDFHALEIIGGSRGSLWIVGHEGEDVFRIDGNIIHVYGLDAGNYTLKVITTPDENHTVVEKTVNVTVNKVNSTLVMPAIVTAKYGEVANIDFTVEGATVDLANITIYGPTGVYVLANVELNGTRIIISNFEMGYFNVTVVTTPDKNHLSVNGSTRLIVDPAHSEVNVTDVVYTYGGVGTSTVTLVGATNVTAVIVGHSEAIVTYADGMISISGLDAGNYILNVTTKPDYNHDAVSTTANVTVNKADVFFSLSDVTIMYGEVVVVKGGFGDGVTGFNGTTLKVVCDGEDVQNVGYSINTDCITLYIGDEDLFNPGNYTFTIACTVDGNHNPASATSSIVVKEIPKSEVNVTDVVYTYGGEGTSTVTLVGATGVNPIIVDHSEATVNYKDGVITISGLDAGKYILKVTTIPMENYASVSKTANVTVNKLNPDVDASNVVFDYGESGTSTVTLPDTVEFNAKVVGHDEAIFSIDGKVITVSNLSAGNYTLNITTVANTNYNSIDAYANITVNKVNSSVSLDDIAFNYGSSATVEVTLDGATDISAVIEGHSDSVSVDGNKITLSNLPCGNYTLNVSTIPDENHVSVTKTVKVAVNKIDPNLAISVRDIQSGDKALVEITTNATFSGEVSVQINNVNYTIGVINGYGNTTVDNLASGNYVATAVFKETDIFKPSTDSTSFKVSKKDATLKINVSNVEYGETVKVNVAVSSADGLVNDGLIVVDVNGNLYNGAVVNGNAVVDISGLNAGEYNANVSYNGDSYEAGQATVSFNVTKLNTAITAAAKAYVINYGGTYSITLKDANGNLLTNKVVTFTLNGKNIGSAKTDSKGVANIKLTASILKVAKAGNKNLVIKFAGDNNYNAVTKTVKITINKEKTKITAKKKTFKRTIKVKKYAITLKNSKGKAIKNAKVTLKVKGKKYTAKTNAKGKAVFKIKKLTKKGTFKAKINFKATSLYLKASKNVKIKCK